MMVVTNHRPKPKKGDRDPMFAKLDNLISLQKR